MGNVSITVRGYVKMVEMKVWEFGSLEDEVEQGKINYTLTTQK